MKLLNKSLFVFSVLFAFSLTACGGAQSAASSSRELTEEELWLAAPRLSPTSDPFTFVKADFVNGKVRMKIGGFEEYHYYGIYVEYINDSGLSTWEHIPDRLGYRMKMDVLEDDNVTPVTTWKASEFRNQAISAKVRLDYYYEFGSAYENVLLNYELRGYNDFIFKGSSKDIHLVFNDSNEVFRNCTYRVGVIIDNPIAHEVGDDGFCPSYHTDTFDGFFYGYKVSTDYGGNRVQELVQNIEEPDSPSNLDLYLIENLDEYSRTGDSPFQGEEFMYDVSIVSLEGVAITDAQPVYLPNYYQDVGGYPNGPVLKALKFTFPLSNAPIIRSIPNNFVRRFFKVVLTPKAGMDTTNVVGSLDGYIRTIQN